MVIRTYNPPPLQEKLNVHKLQNSLIQETVYPYSVLGTRHIFVDASRVTASCRFTNASRVTAMFFQHFLGVIAFSRHASIFQMHKCLKCSPPKTCFNANTDTQPPSTPPGGHIPPSSWRSTSTLSPGDHLTHPGGQLLSLLSVKLIIFESPDK